MRSRRDLKEMFPTHSWRVPGWGGVETPGHMLVALEAETVILIDLSFLVLWGRPVGQGLNFSVAFETANYFVLVLHFGS